MLRCLCRITAERTLKYDKLVLAVGAEPSSGIEKVPGAKEYATPFYTIEDSYRIKQAIRELKVRYSLTISLYF